MREPVTKVFRRAGCGKSARPVRRGDGELRIPPWLSVLLYRPSLLKLAALRAELGRSRDRVSAFDAELRVG